MCSKILHKWYHNIKYHFANCFISTLCFWGLSGLIYADLIHSLKPLHVFYLMPTTISEKAVATHSSTLAWKIPWAEEPGGLQSMGSLRVGGTTEWLHFHFSLSCIGEGNGNPLQCTCRENPRDGGAWWATVSGVAQSRTQLNRLSSSSSSSSRSSNLKLSTYLLFWVTVCA